MKFNYKSLIFYIPSYLLVLFFLSLINLKCENHAAELHTDTILLAKCAVSNLQQPENKTDTTSQSILLIGDSMAYTLIFRLSDYCLQNNHTMHAVTWVSSSTVGFGSCDTLRYYIDKFKASYVIFVIGSNELFVDDIKLHRAKYMERILKQIGRTRCVWIGPPNWKEDTGINDLILEAVGKEKFFLSKNLKFHRRDHAHPTLESASMWMDSIASWIKRESCYKIKLDWPKVKNMEKIKPVVLVPKINPSDTLQTDTVITKTKKRD
jgi:hypothetical protein